MPPSTQVYDVPAGAREVHMVKVSYFHLMPYAVVDEVPKWPVPHSLFDPAIGHDLYRQYLDQMVLADELGFDWVGCNEHHSTPYGLMSNPNLIGAILADRTKQ